MKNTNYTDARKEAKYKVSKQREGTGLLDYQAMRSLREGVVYIYYITLAGNSISTQLGSSFQSNRYGTEKAGGTARPSRTKSHPAGPLSSSQPGGQLCWASHLAFGLIISKHRTHQSHSRPRGWAASLLPPPRLLVPTVPHL